MAADPLRETTLVDLAAVTVAGYLLVALPLTVALYWNVLSPLNPLLQVGTFVVGAGAVVASYVVRTGHADRGRGVGRVAALWLFATVSLLGLALVTYALLWAALGSP